MNESDLKSGLPLSKDIGDYIDSNPKFKASLKLYNADRFATMHTIYITHVPHITGDEIIGLIYVDKKNVRNGKSPYVKQDFIVNHGNGRFTHYTGLTSAKGQSEDVQHISRFFEKYGTDGERFFYNSQYDGRGVHHIYDIEQVKPEQLKAEILTAIEQERAR